MIVFPIKGGSSRKDALSDEVYTHKLLHGTALRGQVMGIGG
jgi:hypothetical protein